MERRREVLIGSRLMGKGESVLEIGQNVVVLLRNDQVDLFFLLHEVLLDLNRHQRLIVIRYIIHYYNPPYCLPHRHHSRLLIEILQNRRTGTPFQLFPYLSLHCRKVHLDFLVVKANFTLLLVDVLLGSWSLYESIGLGLDSLVSEVAGLLVDVLFVGVLL